MTEDTYNAHCAFKPNTAIDPRRVVVMLTSNEAELTVDLANRSSIVRILKQAAGYRFRRYPEGDILNHIRANQPRYLGAVFAVIGAWHAAGKPRTEETRHDFRDWAQVLDWIVQNLLGAAPLMNGHHETQIRMTSPWLNWLRDVALAVAASRRTNQWLIASRVRHHDAICNLREHIVKESAAARSFVAGRDGPWQGFQLLSNQAPRTSQLSLLALDAIRVENTNRGVTQVNIQSDEIHLGLLSVRLAGS